MAWTFCTSGSAIAKAGANASSTITASGSILAEWCNEGEALVCNTSRYDLVTNYGNLTANGKNIVSTIVSCYVAEKIIAYDMKNFSSRSEAALMLNVLENDIRRNLPMLEDEKIKNFLNIT